MPRCSHAAWLAAGTVSSASAKGANATRTGRAEARDRLQGDSTTFLLVEARATRNARSGRPGKGGARARSQSARGGDPNGRAPTTADNQAHRQCALQLI